MFSLNFIFLCSLTEELCTKEENDKTSCNFNFGRECNLKNASYHTLSSSLQLFHFPESSARKIKFLTKKSTD